MNGIEQNGYQGRSDYPRTHQDITGPFTYNFGYGTDTRQFIKQNDNEEIK